MTYFNSSLDRTKTTQTKEKHSRAEFIMVIESLFFKARPDYNGSIYWNLQQVGYFHSVWSFHEVFHDVVSCRMTHKRWWQITWRDVIVILLKYFMKSFICTFLDILLNAPSKHTTNFDSTDLRNSSWKYGANPRVISNNN